MASFRSSGAATWARVAAAARAAAPREVGIEGSSGSNGGMVAVAAAEADLDGGRGQLVESQAPVVGVGAGLAAVAGPALGEGGGGLGGGGAVGVEPPVFGVHAEVVQGAHQEITSSWSQSPQTRSSWLSSARTWTLSDQQRGQ